MLTSCDRRIEEARVARSIGGHTVRPVGPTGLWGALVNASARTVVERELPVTDTLSIRATSSPMFDYDQALAVSLGGELDPISLLG